MTTQTDDSAYYFCPNLCSGDLLGTVNQNIYKVNRLLAGARNELAQMTVVMDNYRTPNKSSTGEVLTRLNRFKLLVELAASPLEIVNEVIRGQADLQRLGHDLVAKNVQLHMENEGLKNELDELKTKFGYVLEGRDNAHDELDKCGVPRKNGDGHTYKVADRIEVVVDVFNGQEAAIKIYKETLQTSKRHMKVLTGAAEGLVQECDIVHNALDKTDTPRKDPDTGNVYTLAERAEMLSNHCANLKFKLSAGRR